MTTSRSAAFPPAHRAIPLRGSTAPDEFVVSALLWIPDGRYLLQLRDDKPGLLLRDHWALFGGHVEPGESAENALTREIEEELAFRPRDFAWYHEAIYVLPRRAGRVAHKVFYVVPITTDDVTRMVQHEGADMRLFAISEMLALPRVSPWDLSVMMMHAREATLFEP